MNYFQYVNFGKCCHISRCAEMYILFLRNVPYELLRQKQRMPDRTALIFLQAVVFLTIS